jgi:glutamyl endopeptidase
VKSEDSNYDWGMIRFSTNVGTTTGYFGALTTNSSQTGTQVTLRGYPGDKSLGQLWTMSGAIVGNNFSSSKLNYQMDTYGGQSGSPVYNSSFQAVAIHTNSTSFLYNQGERIDRSLFDIITNARKW